jgi:hypothetical protein
MSFLTGFLGPYALGFFGLPLFLISLEAADAYEDGNCLGLRSVALGSRFGYQTNPFSLPPPILPPWPVHIKRGVYNCD